MGFSLSCDGCGKNIERHENSVAVRITAIDAATRSGGRDFVQVSDAIRSDDKVYDLCLDCTGPVRVAVAPK